MEGNDANDVYSYVSMAPVTRLRSRVRGFLIWLAFVISLGMLLFTYRHLEALAAGEKENFLEPLTNEMTGALAGGLGFLAVRWLVRRYPLRSSALLRRLPIYVCALPIFGAAGTSFMWGTRELLYPTLGLGDFDYGVMPLRYFMELPMQTIGFAMMVTVLHALDAFRSARERDVRTAQLQSSLARAELQNLRLQLQPHFLFNALNTISSTMYRDAAAADEMIGQLAELLRASLRATQTEEVPLRTELEIVKIYLSIMRARFGDRLGVKLSIDPQALDALVPSFIIQPLLENAVRHGNAEKTGHGSIEVSAVRDGERLLIELSDDGPGVSQSNERAAGGGLGLQATSERLHLLYGEAQSFEAGNGEHGGFVVKAVIPYRRTETGSRE